MSNGMNDTTRRTFEDSARTIKDELRHGADVGAEHVREGFDRATETFDKAAESVSDVVDESRHRIRDASRKVKGAFSDSTEYFRTHGPRGVVRDIEGVVREHPGKALLACVALGFFIGRSLKKER